MNKFYYFMTAALLMLLSTACSNEDENIAGNLNEALVSFNVELSGAMQTKAISDGSLANQLSVKVFDESMKPIASLSRSDVEIKGKKASVSFSLVKGKSYNFLFWASAKGNNCYSIADDGTITVNYTNAKANDESRDAFLGVVKAKAVNGSTEESVILKRPFAQINFLTDDIDEAAASGVIINDNTNSSIVISNAATTLNPFNNTVSGNQEVTFSASAIPVSTETYSIQNKAYRYLGTAYFLVDASGSEQDDGKKQAVISSAKLSVDIIHGDLLSVTSVPAQWNYRTNIYGSLLTASGKFNVSIDVDYEGNHDVPYTAKVVSVDMIDEAIEAGSRDIILTETPTTESNISIPKVFDSGNTDKVSITIPSSDQKMTVAYRDAGSKHAPKEVAITAPTTNGLVINLPNSTVTLNGEKYNSVTATTAANTLIIPEGVEIASLSVNGGNVEVYGNVENISLAEGFNDKVTAYAVFDVKDLNNALKVKAETVLFKSDIDISSAVVSISHNTTFNLLDGVTVTTARQGSDANIVVAEGAELKISGNGTISGDNRLIDVNGILLVNGGKYRTSTKYRGSVITALQTGSVEINECDIIAANCALWIEGNMVINGGKIVSTNSSIDPEVNNGGWSYAVRVIKETGNLTINGGEVEGVQGAVGLYAGKTIVNGGYLHTHPRFSASDNYYALYCSDAVGNAEVNGGKFYAEGKPDVYITNTGKVQLNGGKFEDKGYSEDTKGDIVLSAGYDWNSITEGNFKFEVVKSTTK